jgi:hypothetical protein
VGIYARLFIAINSPPPSDQPGRTWYAYPLCLYLTSHSLITFSIFNTVRGQPFCVGAASNNDGAAVVLLGCGISNAGPNFPNGNFNWTAPFAPLTGQLKTFDNKCLDVPNGSTANGVKLQIWTCAVGNTNQLFQIHRQQIEWKGTGKCLDLTDGNSTIGNPVRIRLFSSLLRLLNFSYNRSNCGTVLYPTTTGTKTGNWTPSSRFNCRCKSLRSHSLHSVQPSNIY